MFIDMSTDLRCSSVGAEYSLRKSSIGHFAPNGVGDVFAVLKSINIVSLRDWRAWARLTCVLPDKENETCEPT